MKSTRLLAVLALSIAFAASVRADGVTVKLSGVHLCCNACVKGVEKAVSKVNGATTVIDKDGGVVAINAASKDTVQKAVNALVAGGYYGKSDSETIKAKTQTGGPQGKVQSLTVEGVHLCCGKCVKAVNDALAKVKGVKGTNAEKNAPSFQVSGDFQASDVFVALEKEGLSGRAGK